MLLRKPVPYEVLEVISMRILSRVDVHRGRCRSYRKRAKDFKARCNSDQTYATSLTAKLLESELESEGFALVAFKNRIESDAELLDEELAFRRKFVRTQRKASQV